MSGSDSDETILNSPSPDNGRRRDRLLGVFQLSHFKGFIVAFLYGTFSISITFFNKAIFELYDFNASNFLTFGQIIVALIFLYTLKKLKYLDFEDFNVETSKTLGSLALSFIAMVVTGLAALRYVNVPMYSALRRLTSFIVILIQYFVLQKTVGTREFISIVMMVLGALVAGWGDLHFDLYGYFLTVLNCVVTALYLVLIAKKSQETGLQTFGLMYYNNILSLPIIVVITLALEWKQLMAFNKWLNPGFLVVFFMSSIQAFLLNYFMFLCSTINSPLTTSITGQLKSILQTIFGLFAFGGVQMTTYLSIGLSVSTFGGVWYGYIKYIEQVTKTKSVANRHHDIESGNRTSKTHTPELSKKALV